MHGTSSKILKKMYHILCRIWLRIVIQPSQVRLSREVKDLLFQLLPQKSQWMLLVSIYNMSGWI